MPGLGLGLGQAFLHECQRTTITSGTKGIISRMKTGFCEHTLRKKEKKQQMSCRGKEI